MMIPAAVIGAILGYWRAARLGGKAADKAQYAAAHGLLFAVLGLILQVALTRFGLI